MVPLNISKVAVSSLHHARHEVELHRSAAPNTIIDIRADGPATRELLHAPRRSLRSPARQRRLTAHQLPDALFIHSIASLLTPADVARAGRVCRNWQTYRNSPVLCSVLLGVVPNTFKEALGAAQIEFGKKVLVYEAKVAELNQLKYRHALGIAALCALTLGFVVVMYFGFLTIPSSLSCLAPIASCVGTVFAAGAYADVCDRLTKLPRPKPPSVQLTDFNSLDRLQLVFDDLATRLTELRAAVVNNDAKAIPRLLGRGLPLEQMPPRRTRTPLDIAVENFIGGAANKEILLALLGAGALAKARHLSAALVVKDGIDVVVAMLAEKSPGERRVMLNGFARNPSSHVSPAFSLDNIRASHDLLTQYAPLFVAVVKNEQRAVATLLDYGANPNDLSGPLGRGSTAMHAAGCYASLEIRRMLRRRGGRVHVRDDARRNPYTLMWAD